MLTMNQKLRGVGSLLHKLTMENERLKATKVRLLVAITIMQKERTYDQLQSRKVHSRRG